ncbi:MULTISPECIES: alpha/beta fold hydrolase [unclassified Synechococcus]|uniref:alpha/beta fold hydrolase n=1 Tax=unclassified Synechococcus TaxID=2626047 RepID=UPI0021A7B7A6|nr:MULTISPECIES: alpha/beta fold hydrolase [unclassified Synechococcus]MCT0212224.1 alpha/beta fold hydrolase [Synechococcus sp. CS-1326]MCT0234363.1 alpha/beta fold hydrolase [Synechococcus sp. CS-1327]
MSTAAAALAAPASSGDRSFALGCFDFHCGRQLSEAQLSYRVYGTLNAERSNLVLYPSSYGAWPEDIDWVVGPILDPTRWCVLLVSQFGNGRSSSPSNSAMGLREDGWVISHRDNQRAQQRLVTERFGVERIALIYGWSMGAQQAYHWGALAPAAVERLFCLCGTARTTPHNRLFLLSLRQALTADPAWDGLRFRALPEQGLRSFALIYASWAASQAFYRERRHEALGYPSVDDYVERSWLPAYRRHDPHDLVAMLDTWLDNDLALAMAAANGSTQPGDLAAALGAIQARTTVMAGSHDLYFLPDDCAAEAALIPGSRFERIESVLGHRAGNPRDAPREQALIRAALDRLCPT